MFSCHKLGSSVFDEMREAIWRALFQIQTEGHRSLGAPELERFGGAWPLFCRDYEGLAVAEACAAKSCCFGLTDDLFRSVSENEAKLAIDDLLRHTHIW